VNAREWVLPIALTKPLSLNDRMHWQQKRHLTKRWRDHAHGLAVAAGIPLLERFTAILHYQPRDNRRRDTDNLVATLKPLVDGLRDAHVAVDDDTTHYRLSEPVIHPARKGEPARMWLTVIDLSDEPGQTAIPIAPEHAAQEKLT
jgi:crossover junction endodeoxyribonuclease RusA